LFFPVTEQSQAAPLRDHIQMALAIADSTALKSLLANCLPAIAPPHLLDAVSIRIGVPIPDGHAVDAVMQYEVIRCIQAPPPDPPPDRQRPSRNADQPMAWQSDLQVLVDGVPCSWARQVLLTAEFTDTQIDAILQLPNDAWHKSWWYILEPTHQVSDRFLRLMRTRRYPNGNVMIQYKDCFPKEQPCCFRSQTQRAIIVIRAERQPFATTLKTVNTYRQALGIDRVILLCDTISELEAQGFINQGICLYALADLLLPLRADCQQCASTDCVMNGREQSPVLVCQNFHPWEQRV
jgi:hypothetical protein